MDPGAETEATSQATITELRRLVGGFQVSQAIHVAATLGIADLLDDTGSRTSGELAEACSADPDALYRLLRALASVGVFREEHPRRFSHTRLSRCLRTDEPGSLAGWATLIGRPYYWEAWAHLVDSVRTGENAFRLAHGTDVWQYRAGRPEETAIFDRAMTGLTAGSASGVISAYDFGRFHTVVDVGGGRGAFIAAVLAAHATVDGVLYDQAHVVSGAATVLEAAGVADRCRIEAGSFFEGVPAGGDAYVLKAILHDWDDAEAVAILRACRAAMHDDARLLVVEREIGGANTDPEPKFSDLNMLVAPGGRERTEAEFAALFAAADLALAGVTRSQVGLSVIEGRPTSSS